MNTNEVLKLALDALEINNKAWKALADSGDAGFWEAEEQPFYELSVKAISALREALANEALDRMAENARELGLDYEPAQQEPVAVHQFRKRGCSDWYDGYPDHTDGRGPYQARTLYTSPPAQRKPLTDEEIGKLDCVYALWDDGESCTIMGIKDFARAIEAAHGIKENT